MATLKIDQNCYEYYAKAVDLSRGVKLSVPILNGDKSDGTVLPHSCILLSIFSLMMDDAVQRDDACWRIDVSAGQEDPDPPSYGSVFRLVLRLRGHVQPLLDANTLSEEYDACCRVNNRTTCGADQFYFFAKQANQIGSRTGSDHPTRVSFSLHGDRLSTARNKTMNLMTSSSSLSSNHPCCGILYNGADVPLDVPPNILQDVSLHDSPPALNIEEWRVSWCSGGMNRALAEGVRDRLAVLLCPVPSELPRSTAQSLRNNPEISPLLPPETKLETEQDIIDRDEAEARAAGSTLGDLDVCSIQRPEQKHANTIANIVSAGNTIAETPPMHIHFHNVVQRLRALGITDDELNGRSLGLTDEVVNSLQWSEEDAMLLLLHLSRCCPEVSPQSLALIQAVFHHTGRDRSVIDSDQLEAIVQTGKYFEDWNMVARVVCGRFLGFCNDPLCLREASSAVLWLSEEGLAACRQLPRNKIDETIGAQKKLELNSCTFRPVDNPNGDYSLTISVPFGNCAPVSVPLHHVHRVMWNDAGGDGEGELPQPGRLKFYRNPHIEVDGHTRSPQTVRDLCLNFGLIPPQQGRVPYSQTTEPSSGVDAYLASVRRRQDEHNRTAHEEIIGTQKNRIREIMRVIASAFQPIDTFVRSVMTIDEIENFRKRIVALHLAEDMNEWALQMLEYVVMREVRRFSLSVRVNIDRARAAAVQDCVNGKPSECNEDLRAQLPHILDTVFQEATIAQQFITDDDNAIILRHYQEVAENVKSRMSELRQNVITAADAFVCSLLREQSSWSTDTMSQTG